MRVRALLAGFVPVFAGILLTIYCMPWIETHHSGYWTKDEYSHGNFWILGFMLAGAVSAWLARGREWTVGAFWTLVALGIVIFLNFVEPYETLRRFAVPAFQDGWKDFLFISAIFGTLPLWMAGMVEHFRGPEVSEDLASDAAESITEKVLDHFHHHL
jgi:hypothetical protein